MLNLSNLKPKRGSVKRRKMVGRGVGSGHGTFSGRGAKGQKARSGSSIPLGFEGGRMPLHRQLPKLRGFRSRRPKAAIVDLDQIDKHFVANETVNPKQLLQRGLLADPTRPVKILAGQLTKTLSFEGVKLSAAARQKVEQLKGTVRDDSQPSS